LDAFRSRCHLDDATFARCKRGSRRCGAHRRRFRASRAVVGRP
jgi:hypothetical protein